MMSAVALPQHECLEHRKSTKCEGRTVLIWLVITISMLGVLQYFMFPSIWLRNNGFVIAFFSIEAVLAIAALCYATVNLLADTEFECRINETSITCASPANGCGESFSIVISEITKVEKEDWGDGAYRWYIWNASGHRFWLTSNYDNPVDRFIEVLLERNPSIVEITT